MTPKKPQVDIIKLEYIKRIDDWEVAIDHHFLNGKQKNTASGTHQIIPNSQTNNTGNSISASPIPSLISKKSLVESAIQAQLLQTWGEFLSEIYQEAIRLKMTGQLKKKISGGKGKTQVRADININDLENINAKNLKKVLLEGIKENFSWFDYDKKIGQVINMFDTPSRESSDCKLIQKHIAIRNIFQHHQGVFNTKSFSKDTKLKSATIVDEGQNVITLVDGDEIPLSCKELKNLCKAIKNMINNTNE